MSQQPDRLNIIIINGSVRPRNLTGAASALVAEELRKDGRVEVTTVDPLKYELAYPGMKTTDGAVQLQGLVRNAAGIVFATPEYHGSFSSVTKLVIENLGFPSALAGKPVALLGVASGSIGAIKSLEHLRGVCSHVGAMVMPLPISIPFVHKVFDSAGRCTDEKTERLIRSVAIHLMNYIHQHVCPRFQLEQLLRQESVLA